VDYNVVSEDYFETLGIPVVTGRGFGPEEAADSPPVAIVSRRLAARVWPDGQALGQQLVLEEPGRPEVTVVGVVHDLPNQVIGEQPEPLLYLPMVQSYVPELHVVVRSQRPGAEARQLVDGVISRLDPRMARVPVSMLEERVGLGVLPHRAVAALASGLSVIALCLAAMGVFGVVSMSVTTRFREIGVRRALGASRATVVGAAVGRCLRWIVPGAALGALMSALAGHSLESMLINVDPTDGRAVGATLLLLFLTVAGGAWLPAMRASRVDPVAALRED
jgi:predicted lysophospholipase L1 biosynthesis ABC-type transport system permease subunit